MKLHSKCLTKAFLFAKEKHENSAKRVKCKISAMVLEQTGWETERVNFYSIKCGRNMYKTRSLLSKHSVAIDVIHEFQVFQEFHVIYVISGGECKTRWKYRQVSFMVIVFYFLNIIIAVIIFITPISFIILFIFVSWWSFTIHHEVDADGRLAPLVLAILCVRFSLSIVLWVWVFCHHTLSFHSSFVASTAGGKMFVADVLTHQQTPDALFHFYYINIFIINIINILNGNILIPLMNNFKGCREIVLLLNIALSVESAATTLID